MTDRLSNGLVCEKLQHRGNTMKLTQMTLALCVAAVLVPVSAIGQDEDASDKGASAKEATEHVDDADDKSPSELRRDHWRAKKDFFALYNKLNDNGLYDVVCSKETPTGGRIRVESCRPKFLDRIVSSSSTNPDAELAQHREIYYRNMAALLAANPELKEAADKLDLAHARVEADKEKRAQ